MLIGFHGHCKVIVEMGFFLIGSEAAHVEVVTGDTVCMWPGMGVVGFYVGQLRSGAKFTEAIQA